MLAGAAATVLSGCAAIPRLGAAPQMKPASAYAAAESFKAPATQWPNDRWWAAYRDPQLDELIEAALTGSPDLAAARARVRQADALAEQVESTLGPQLNAVAMAGESKLSYNNGLPPAIVTHGWRDAGLAGLNLNWQIDFFGKNRALLAGAVSEKEAAQAEAAAARLTLSTAIAGAYADLAQLYEDRDATQDALKVRSESQTLIDQRVAQGLETQATSERTHADRASAEAELAAIDESIGLTKNRIATLVGKGPDIGLSIERPHPGAIRAFGLPANLQAELIGRRPDVVAARLAAEAAGHRVKAAKADFYPNVNLAAFAGYESLGLANLAKSGSQFGTVGPAVTLPIFESGRLQGAYRGALGQYDAAVAIYDQAVTHALAEVADSAISARALDARLGKSREALAAAQNAYHLASQRYDRGLGTYLEVLAAEDALVMNQRAVADLEMRAFTLDVALIRALGGGYRA
ncbi:efflux transporter outer membrane subunit [Phenylobacterium montanum]|uniref:Efflux transporter outer membrane subunit n=1 Tax=Phenylobacterium montanum TaxID=2823693 RepID=A0A975G4E1_9CAUL|nr:efflux transporter outer membrane subunit [Caulobacter sp. S6]QUD90354.1 efflux transporter outer membrane subunit [Caulobacter sp. S6]